MSNSHDNIYENLPDDPHSSTDPYRPLSSKRLRARTPRKSVSFNDVPIVHEVPSHDATRNSNSDIYRSWTFTDTTSPITVVSPFASPQILPPFNSSSAAAQKLHANRLSSVLYSSSTNTTTLNRLCDWPLRPRTMKTTTDEISELNPPLIVIHQPDEPIIKTPSLVENIEDRRHFYRSAITSDPEHYRNLPFSYLPLSESTTAYTSMLPTAIIQPNEQTFNESARALRARSATLPITIAHPSPRNNDNISITTFRPTTATHSSSRTVLKPATIAFHSSTPKPPPVPTRSHSYAAHSRLMSSANRPLSSSNKHSTHSTTLSRTRSANVASTRHQTHSPIVMLDNQSAGVNSNNLYTTTKRNPNVRPNSNSYHMHHILLPANIN